MSLPPAKKDISDHPAKTGVTDPTNKAELEADVTRKLKFYGVIQAFREGRLPDNAQIDETLKWVNEPKNSPVNTENLSEEGNKLIQDVKNIIETARQLVEKKNGDEIIQNFIAHTSGIDYKSKGQADVKPPVSKEEVKDHGGQGVEHLRTLLQLLLTNSETRKLLSDFSLIGRDLCAIGAGKATEKLRPDSERMAQVDAAAPESQWSEEKTTLKESFKDLGKEVTGAHASGEKPRADGAATENGPITPSSPDADAPPTTTAEDGTAVPTAKAAEKKTIKSRMAGFKGRVPDKQRTAAKDHYEKTKKFLTEEYFPKDRRDQFIYRFKKVVIECQSHPKYKEALEWFLSTLETYFGHAKSVGGTGGEHSKALFRDNPTLQQSTNELRTILERFANGASMTPMFDAMNQMREDANKDEGLREWWKRVDSFVRKSLLEPGFIISSDFNTEMDKLRDDGRQFFEDKYKGHKDNLVDQMSEFFKAFGEDPLNKQFGDNWNSLTRDLLFNEKGKLEYKPHLWKDIRAEILPSLIQKVGYVPIPRIEYMDDKLDLVIENLTLQGRNLFPNIMDINLNNHIRVSPYAAIKDEQTHTLTLSLSQMQADMRDVAFYYNKKGGFPKIKDAGLADVFIGGHGITAFVKLYSQGLDGTGPRMGGDVFKIKSVKVKVDSLKFSIRDSKHDLLYKTLRPLAAGLIKLQISKAVSDGIRKGLEALNDQLVQVRDKMQNPDKDPEFSRTAVIKEHFSKKSKDSSVASPSSEKRSSTFKIVPKRDSMILPDIGYEKGWIKRQEEFEERSKLGEGWKSAAFSIIPDSPSASAFAKKEPGPSGTTTAAPVVAATA